MASYLFVTMEEVLRQDAIVESEQIRVRTVTTDNEGTTRMSADLLANFVGSVRCVIHTSELCVKDCLDPDLAWKKYSKKVNAMTTFFNQISKQPVPR